MPPAPAPAVAAGSAPVPSPSASASSSSSQGTVTTTRRGPGRRQLLLLSSLSSAGSSCTGLLALAAPAGNSISSSAGPVVTEAELAASAVVSRRVGEAVRLLEVGRELQARGEFAGALASFTGVVREYADLALSEYARVGRALVLYEVGDRDESIAEMEDVSIALKGYPEIHAALAAALYADKHAALLAENQFAIATLLDPHYADLAYVRDTKHWPPSLVASLREFITLS